MPYSVQMQGNPGYLHVVIEHQSKPDKKMAFRMMRYSIAAMHRHLEADHDKLPLVVPILFYQGEATPYPLSMCKVVATNSALTHYNMIGFGSAQVMGENPDFALMFVAPMDADGVKLISRASYEMVAGATGSPYDYPLSSRFCCIILMAMMEIYLFLQSKML